MAYSLPLHCLSVGDRINVYWEGDRKWFPGEIVAAEGDHRCEVLYDDGDQEWVSLDETRYVKNRSRARPARRRTKRRYVDDDFIDLGDSDDSGLGLVRNGFVHMEESYADYSSTAQSEGKVEKMFPRRSNRIRKFRNEDTIYSKYCSIEEDFIGTSTKAETHSNLVASPSPPSMVTEAKQFDSGINHHSRDSDSSKYADGHQGKRHGDMDVDSDKVIDDSLNERSAGGNNEVCSEKLSDGPICSICQIGVASDFLMRCKGLSCYSAFHSFCLDPPLDAIEEDWLCLCCAGDALNEHLAKQREQNAKRIQSIVGHRRIILEHQRNGFQDQFLIKWESLSHYHDSWVPAEWLFMVDRIRLQCYRKKYPIMDAAVSIDHRKPEWFKIDRVIACRRKLSSDVSCEIWDICTPNWDKGDFEFLVKWMGLDYCESTWETSCTEEFLAEVDKLIQRHIRAAERADNHPPESSISQLDKIPDKLYGGILYDYQLQGLHWILSNFIARKNVILADEMGLGKTVQVVSFVHCMKQAKLDTGPVLIIAPKSILFQWEKEFCRWAKELNVILYQGEKRSRQCIRMHDMYSSKKGVLFDVLITNYERVLLENSFLKKFKWSAIIIDEAHKIKRLDCKLTSCLNRYTSAFRLLLTGTPLQNTLLELFSLLHFVDPKEFSDPKAEAEAFSSISAGRRHSEVELKIAQIHELLRPRMLRRMKSDVLPGTIPVKQWVEVPCALTDSQRELYIDILEKNYIKLNKGIESGKKIVLNFILMELKKCCNHPYLIPGREIFNLSREAYFVSLVENSGKLQLLEKLLPRLKDRGNRVLLFSQMTKMLDILEDFLVFLGLAYFRIDGKTSIAARQQQMKEFNDPNSDISVFLISTRAGGLGIDLPTADRVIIYDPDFNPFMDLQAQSRAHRIGQTRPVVVYQLITKCTVEERILQKSKEKLEMENLVMNPSRKPAVDELHSMLLHGARTILDKENIYLTSVHYDNENIEKLLELDPKPGEQCSIDDSGYLGSIQSFIPGGSKAEERSLSPKVDEWKEILGSIPAERVVGDFGRGKRQKKEVKYECEDEADSDEVYSPEGSSTDGSSDDSESEVPERDD